MAEHQERWPVAVLCEGLEGSRSGLYESLPRDATTAVEAEDVAVLARVKAMAAETRQSSGSRRRAKQLQEEGFAVGRAKARRLMQEAGVAVKRPKRRGPRTTASRQGYAVAPNLLARQCDVQQPHAVWAGDITSVWTGEGWV